MDYKKTIKLLFFGGILACLLSFSLVFAQKTDITGQADCSAVDTVYDRVKEKAENYKERLNSKRADIAEKLAALVSRRNSELAGNRGQWDVKREELYERLRNHATTTAGQEAVEDFIFVVEEAVKTRRSAVDGAIESFRTGSEQVLVSHKNEVDDAIVQFSSAIDSIYESAKTECEAGGNGREIISQAREKFRTAREEFMDDIRGITDLRTLARPLVDARREAIVAANEQFKNALQAAIQELRSALGQ